MASITLAELHLFHSIDRQIFSRLVISLKRQASQSLLVLAFWLWLESAKHCQIITKLTKLSDNLLDSLTNEATLCINFLKSKTNTPTTHGGSLYLMSRVLNKEISLKTISELKYTAISGVKFYLNEVCAWIFTDFLLQVLPQPSNFNTNNTTTPILVPGFPDPTFGPLEIYAMPPSVTIPRNGSWGWKLEFEAPIDDRTIFLTFSRGFPVSEEEARQFFTQMCGDNCIESFEMEVNNDPKVQSLYARMVLRSVAYMDQIMGGKHVAKFRSKGKHIWARKFERREHPS